MENISQKSKSATPQCLSLNTEWMRSRHAQGDSRISPEATSPQARAGRDTGDTVPWDEKPPKGPKQRDT